VVTKLPTITIGIGKGFERTIACMQNLCVKVLVKLFTLFRETIVMRELKSKKHRRMPVSLQIHNLKRVFVRANPYLEDPYAEMDNIDWVEILDKTLHFDENLHNFEEEYPQYRWRVPKKKKSPEKTRHEWKKVAVRNKINVYTTKVEIKPHKVKAKNRTYLHGRIQVSVDKKWIGCRATISVGVPTMRTRV